MRWYNIIHCKKGENNKKKTMDRLQNATDAIGIPLSAFVAGLLTDIARPLDRVAPRALGGS